MHTFLVLQWFFQFVLSSIVTLLLWIFRIFGYIVSACLLACSLCLVRHTLHACMHVTECMFQTLRPYNLLVLFINNTSSKERVFIPTTICFAHEEMSVRERNQKRQTTTDCNACMHAMHMQKDQRNAAWIKNDGKTYSCTNLIRFYA